MLTLDDLCCDELAESIWNVLDRVPDVQIRGVGQGATPEERFSASMATVVRGIETQRRFALLKRFIAHGSLLPSWETRVVNSTNPLDDEELADCMDFISGHMVTKFQGRLAEILAAEPLVELVEGLQRSGGIPGDAELVFGDTIRCAPSSRTAGHSGSIGSGVEGPDALVYRMAPGEQVEILLLGETKSGYVTPGRLRKQWDHHLAAVAAGVCIGTRWYGPDEIRSLGAPIRVFVRPSTWKLTRKYSFERDGTGTDQLIMETQIIPAEINRTHESVPNEFSIRLGWSYDALRAAAFTIAHRYMRIVGLALSDDPAGGIRTDLAPEEAGENDFLAQLHVAIFRQQDAEPDPMRRAKTIELYNVLGFGWALGHAFLDQDRQPAMLCFEDLHSRP
jgi:hypothetical protein